MVGWRSALLASSFRFDTKHYGESLENIYEEYGDNSTDGRCFCLNHELMSFSGIENTMVRESCLFYRVLLAHDRFSIM